MSNAFFKSINVPHEYILLSTLFLVWLITISRIAFCQIRAPGPFDEVYGSMLKGKKELQCNYNELGKSQYCTVLVFTIVKT